MLKLSSTIKHIIISIITVIIVCTIVICINYIPTKLKPKILHGSIYLNNLNNQIIFSSIFKDKPTVISNLPENAIYNISTNGFYIYSNKNINLNWIAVGI